MSKKQYTVLTEGQIHDLEQLALLPPDIQWNLIAYAAGMVTVIAQLEPTNRRKKQYRLR